MEQFSVGQTWTPTRDGSRAKARTIVWVGDAPPSVPVWEPLTVGYVCDAAKPLFKEGHDSWMSMESWKAWVKKHGAKVVGNE
jgi:hypothetical protein